MNNKKVAAAIAAGSAMLYLFTRGAKKGLSEMKYPNPNERSRGYRNNNPLNIRISSTIWQGMIPTANNGDGSFVQFTSMAYGFRAAMRNIRTYIVNYGTNTVQAIINRWAPPTENLTSKYVTDVCRLSGLQPGTIIGQNNKQQMSALVKAMAYIENGYYCDNIDNYINQAWSLYV